MTNGAKLALVGAGALALYLLTRKKAAASAGGPSLVGGVVTMQNPAQLGQTSEKGCFCPEDELVYGGPWAECGCDEPTARVTPSLPWLVAAPIYDGAGGYAPRDDGQPLGVLGMDYAMGAE